MLNLNPNRLTYKYNFFTNIKLLIIKINYNNLYINKLNFKNTKIHLNFLSINLKFVSNPSLQI